MHATHPSKEQVHDWMARRQQEHTPPPEPDEIRRQLGWHLVHDPDPEEHDTPR